CLGRELERRPREVRRYHPPLAVRQEERHLTGPTTQLHHRRPRGNRGVELSRKITPLAARPKRGEVLARRIPRKWRRLVEAPHLLGSRVQGEQQPRDATWIFVLGATLQAPQIGQGTEAARTGEQGAALGLLDHPTASKGGLDDSDAVFETR